MHSTRYTLHLQVIMIVVVPAKMYPANFKWTMEHWLYMRYEFFSSHNVLYGGWLSMLFSEDVQINLTNLITHTHTFYVQQAHPSTAHLQHKRHSYILKYLIPAVKEHVYLFLKLIL